MMSKSVMLFTAAAVSLGLWATAAISAIEPTVSVVAKPTQNGNIVVAQVKKKAKADKPGEEK